MKIPFMFMKKILTGILLFLPMVALPQVYRLPNYAFKSHPTMVLESIDRHEDETILHFSLENRKLFASFCVSKETYIQGIRDSIRHYLLRTEGIPNCPDQHNFRSVGEKLYFRLYFPPIPDDIRYINVVEDCREACFSFSYVLLDKELNSTLNQAFRQVERGDTEEAIDLFTAILEEDDGQSPVYGNVIMYLIDLYKQSGHTVMEKEMSSRLERSAYPHKEAIKETLATPVLY